MFTFYLVARALLDLVPGAALGCILGWVLGRRRGRAAAGLAGGGLGGALGGVAGFFAYVGLYRARLPFVERSDEWGPYRVYADPHHPWSVRASMGLFSAVIAVLLAVGAARGRGPRR